MAVTTSCFLLGSDDHYGKKKSPESGIIDSLSLVTIAEVAAEQEAIFSPDDVALTFWYDFY